MMAHLLELLDKHNHPVVAQLLSSDYFEVTDSADIVNVKPITFTVAGACHLVSMRIFGLTTDLPADIYATTGDCIQFSPGNLTFVFDGVPQ